MKIAMKTTRLDKRELLSGIAGDTEALAQVQREIDAGNVSARKMADRDALIACIANKRESIAYLPAMTGHHPFRVV